MKSEIDQTIQRTRRYWHIDGLVEMAKGFICLLLGLYFYGMVVLPEGTPVRFFLESGFVLIIIGFGLLLGQIVQYFKTRITYPRTGYIAYRQTKGYQRWLTGILAMLVASGLAVFFTRSPASLAWMPAITGLLIGAVWAVLAYQYGIFRFYALAALSLLAGFALGASGLENTLGLAAYYALVGFGALISGGLTLISYLRHSSPVTDDE